jgi:hypothetical protein
MGWDMRARLGHIHGRICLLRGLRLPPFFSPALAPDQAEIREERPDVVLCLLVVLEERVAGSPLERMRWVQARLQAEADMASERRAERRRARIEDRMSIARARARAAARNVITG